ncbi:MobA-like NTP transferase domain protein [mine drainage metagenome]|uniref:MobA-like NTP transferase domain protein n=1 Tax=mine drainage metagenome TaxID=410659 RepID=A0A1J5Q4N1_9ZZZZ
MAQALQRACHDAPAALLLGADCPALDAACMQRAARALRDADLVFVPALDGGFALVGCHATAAAATSRLFAERTWSVADVMQRMREGLRDLSLRWLELDALADIDTPDDLAALPPALQDALQPELRCDGCC